MIVGIAVALVFVGQGAPDVSAIDAMARRKDVEGLTRLLTPLPTGVRNPFSVLRTGGAYDVGRLGWRASELTTADGKESYVVIGTPLTSQDVGEIVLRRSGLKLTFIPESDALGARVTHHKFDFRFDIGAKRAFLTDEASFTFTPSSPANVLFRMSPAYQVRKISDEKGNLVPYRQASGVVAFNRPLASKVTLKIDYDAVVNLPQYAGSISEREATLVNDYWYPMIARMPATYEIAMHAPKEWISVGQGQRVEVKDTSNDRITRYKMDLPVVYFSVISAPFKTFSQKLGSRTYSVWSPRMSQDEMRIQTELYQGIVDYYAKTFGDPPYPMYGAVDSPAYGGGALEAYTFATYGGGLPSYDAHEPAHTWWGGLINNTYLGSFWNESFAVFSDGLYHREVPIGNRDERRLAFVESGEAEPSYAGAAMIESGADIGPVGSSLGYGKGAKVLQMLAQAFGVDTVTDAMKTWVRTHPKGQPGDWADFEKVFYTKNGTPEAKGFFRDWVYRPGYADFDADVTYADKAVKIHLKWKSARYRMPLTVMTENAKGERRFTTVFLDGTNDDVSIKLDEKPVLVSLDPWRQALRPIAASERSVDLGMLVGRLPKFVDPSHTDWLENVGRKGTAPSAGIDPAGKFLVGSPETWPAMRALCERVGFEVRGNSLTYKGTKIDLRESSALAIVDLDGGKQCVIGLGKVRYEPEFGSARLVVTDDLGRFLRGVAEPKTSGKLTYRL